MGIIGSWEGYTSSPLYLFNNGIWSNLQTTGTSLVYVTTFSDFTSAYPTGSLSGSTSTTNIGIYGYRGQSEGGANTSGVAFARLNQAVNLTIYNKLCMDNVSISTSFGTANFYFGVSSNANLSSHNYAAYISRKLSMVSGNDSTQVTESKVIDVSGLSGNYYIYFSFTFTKYSTGDNFTTRACFYGKNLYLTV